MSNRRRLRSILQPCVAVVAGSCIALGSEPGTFDRTLAVSGPVRLDVKSDPGGIVITIGSAATLKVHAVIKPRYGRLDLDVAEANIRALEQNPPIEQVGNSIRIGYVKTPGLLTGITMHLEIEAPRLTEVHAYTESGGIRVDGVAGPVATVTSSGRTEITNVAAEITAKGHSGAILIRNTGGPVSVRNQSGGIQLLNIGGTVDAETMSGRTEISDVSGETHSTTHSGSISIDNAKEAVIAHNNSGSIDAFQLGGSVHAETRSGAIRISQISPAPIRALADSGSISVELARQSAYVIDAQSTSGKVSGPALNGIVSISEDHRLKEQIGTGGPLVDLDTRSSKIVVN
jgi:ribosomal protein S28E/S33